MMIPSTLHPLLQHRRQRAVKWDLNIRTILTRTIVRKKAKSTAKRRRRRMQQLFSWGKRVFGHFSPSAKTLVVQNTARLCLTSKVRQFFLFFFFRPNFWKDYFVLWFSISSFYHRSAAGGENDLQSRPQEWVDILSKCWHEENIRSNNQRRPDIQHFSIWPSIWPCEGKPLLSLLPKLDPFLLAKNATLST